MFEPETGRINVVRNAAGKWADDLIDLGRMNTLLYFKDTKTSTLDLTEADPAALTRLLAGQKTHLSALIEDPNEHRSACTRARNIRKKIVAFDEEQGINVGHLARGLVRVTPPGSVARTSAARFRAPLLLQALTVHTRTSAESDFTLEVADEPTINPVLLYALVKECGADLDSREFGEKVAALLAEITDPAEHVQETYGQLEAALADSGLSTELESRTVVGIFNYDKLPMVEDLQESSELLAGHDVIAAIAGYQPAIDALEDSAANDPVVSSDEIPPAQDYLVHDADSSQQVAISRALGGAHVLIDGPPGTGKSQTIANIIAGMAAHGRRVLFVAEKRAAIEAVTDRLTEVDLAHLVFDLHDKRINRRHVAQQLMESLDRAGSEPPPDVADLDRRLARLREDVIRHPEELHRAREPWGLSYYLVQSELLGLPAQYETAIRFHESALRDLDTEKLDDIEADLKAYVDMDGLRIRRGGSVWSNCGLRDQTELRKVLICLDSLTGQEYQTTRSGLEALVGRAGLRPPGTMAGWRGVLELLNDVTQTLEIFDEGVFEQDLDSLLFATGNRAWRKQHPGGAGFWQRRALTKKAKILARNGLSSRGALHEALISAADQYARWRSMSENRSGPASVAGLDAAMRAYERLRDNLAAVAMCAKISDLDRHSAREIETTISRLNADRRTLHRMPELNRLNDRLTAMGLGALLDELGRRAPDAATAAGILRWAWLSSLLDEFRLISSHLNDFTGVRQSRVVSEYRQADLSHKHTNAARVRRQVAKHLREARDTHPDQSRLVRDQAVRKRRHMPMRRLIEKAPDVLLTARPCWAMSPVVVSRMLPPDRLFDMVIFDEASQVEPQDAMTSIMRGRQLVVAGDPKQLPPTPYFRRALSGALDTEDDDLGEDGDLTVYESILERAQSAIPHRSRLRWHYRSRDERLIAFSNTQIYDGDLTTFPGTARQAPLHLNVVNGITVPGQHGSAPEEVDEVVRLVLEHAEHYPDEGLGVITMGLRHADRIDMAILRARSNRPELNGFFSDERGPRERFFVKSLENVQGDERDAIILSIGYAKSAAGTLALRFGALTREDGDRRLNVAITRARKRVTVVSSFHPTDLSPQRLQATKHRGAELLRLYLEYTADPSRIDPGPSGGTASLNGFEQSVLTALQSAGLPVWPQWGVAGYRIDFAIAHPRRPSEMVLAVETDGERYHRVPAARDRDRLRQQQLERLGWRFHRVWSADWMHDRHGETEKIVRAWRQAVADADNGTGPERKSYAGRAPGREQAREAILDRGPRPPVPPGQNIKDYSDQQLVDICLWLLHDRRHLAREDRIKQAMAQLGFQKKGSIIVRRLSDALSRSQRIFDHVDGD